MVFYIKRDTHTLEKWITIFRKIDAALHQHDVKAKLGASQVFNRESSDNTCLSCLNICNAHHDQAHFPASIAEQCDGRLNKKTAFNPFDHTNSFNGGITLQTSQVSNPFSYNS